MKTLFTFFLVIFLVELCFSQSFNANVKAYYDVVYQAEEAILDSNYSKAVVLYQNAFLCNSPFILDINNAIMACEISQNTLQLNEFVKLKAALDTNAINPVQVTLLTLDTTIEIEFYSTYDLLEIVNSDQSIRDSCSKITMDFYRNEALAFAIKKIDYENSDRIIKSVTPTLNMNLKALSNVHVNAISLVTLHNTAWQNYELFSLILSLCEIGKYDVRILAELIDRIPDNNKNYKELPIPLCNKYYMTHNFYINSTLFIEHLDIIKKKEVDSLRTSMCLTTYDQHVNRMIYQYYDKRFHFYNEDHLRMSTDEHDYFVKKFSNNPQKKYTILMNNK